MKKILKKGFVVILFILSGCDPSSSYRKVISNQSGNELIVKLYSLSNGFYSTQPRSTVSIRPNSDILIYDASGIGVGNPTCVGKSGMFGDSIAIEVFNSAALKVNIEMNSEKSWTRNSSGNSMKGYTIECKAVINQSDIVPK